MAQDEATVSNEFVGLSINNPNLNFLVDDPPPPMISSEGIIATDITSKFASAAAALQPGELIKDGQFTLFESVGALEIMDPKMDSGCLAPGESLDEDYDVTRPLLPSEVLGIIDQLLCLEMAWHLGYPLSQTLLTNVYIEAMLMPMPTTIQNADFINNHPEGTPRDPMFGVLRAYCLGLIKSCWYVTEHIKMEHYYEEEDFVTNTYHRPLLDHIGIYEIRDEIMAARTLVHSLRHKITDQMATALGFRLELRAAFLRALELAELRSNPESLSLPWSQMKNVWGPINKSRHLGTPVPEAFSTKIQRRLASTMPPRPIVQFSFEETYEHFKKLFIDGIDVLKVLNYSDPQSLLNFVLTFQAQKPQPLVYIRTLLQNFLFKDMIILGHLSIRQVMDDDLAIVVMPAHRLLDPANDMVETPHDPRFAMAHQMETFRQRAAQSYLDIFRAFCQNRCRVRRTLCHSIQDWETVQIDAEEIDQLLQIQLDEKPIMYNQEGVPQGTTGELLPLHLTEPSYSLPLSSWAYLYKLRLMEWIVQLGFELETYQPTELAGMYWYLSYLAKIRASHLERIKLFTIKRHNEMRAAAHPKALSASVEAQFERSLKYLKVSTLDAAVTWEFADALSCLYTALYRLGLIVPPPQPYSTDRLRYEVRMKPFAPIGLPELPTFEQYVASSARPGKTVDGLLNEAKAGIMDSRKAYEALANRYDDREAFCVGAHERRTQGVKGCVKSTIAANIALATVAKAVANSVASAAEANGRAATGNDVKDMVQVEVPKPDKGYHEWWIVPKVVEKKHK
ncbi:Mak10 subunit, NatC N-terminal acetyltransferase-domain-containing protein [Apodospora peruviana]|uniref:Mak10 subunit, NatC N-terminal acetyltransferase-domain-containing protein n=1 Tax=Apodospora peruviana TaxID=516989 RepID=A0AAE0HZG5_9PEZI|nr:Mak10 subunit, NatC N-terminal acetyltransferase-domain-containing protein [Apodospora peruviana]